MIEVSRYRPTCANNGCPQVLLHAFNRVPLAADALQISGELDAVTVQGSGPVDQPLVPGVGTVSLDLTWTGVGTVARDEHEEGERFRRARAAGVLRAGTTNFTPQVSRRRLHRGVVSAPIGRDGQDLREAVRTLRDLQEELPHSLPDYRAVHASTGCC